MSEVERVVFILREVFGYEYEEIASIVDKSSVNCRKIFNVHEKHFGETEGITIKHKENGRYVEKFVSSLQCGDAQGMLEVLKTDAIFKSDGGGKVTTAINPIYSADKIIRLLLELQND